MTIPRSSSRLSYSLLSPGVGSKLFDFRNTPKPEIEARFGHVAMAINGSGPVSFDHFVGEGEQIRRQFEADRFRSL